MALPSQTPRTDQEHTNAAWLQHNTLTPTSMLIGGVVVDSKHWGYRTSIQSKRTNNQTNKPETRLNHNRRRGHLVCSAAVQGDAAAGYNCTARTRVVCVGVWVLCCTSPQCATASRIQLPPHTYLSPHHTGYLLHEPRTTVAKTVGTALLPLAGGTSCLQTIDGCSG